MGTRPLRVGCLVCLLTLAFAESVLGDTITVLWDHKS
jgi:hypothetical protein